MSVGDSPAGAAPGRAPDWHSIDWKKVHRTVRRLQARIVKALRAGKWGKVKSLVYLLTHSFAGRALAILRVVSNSGARTPGCDAVLWNTPELKSAAFSTLRRHGYQPKPLRRVYIPKSNGKLRPLGIPCMVDRAMQALYLLGLDPIEETLTDPNSYGFRQGRRCADALSRVHQLVGIPDGARWILEGDIASCYDRISHDWLLANIPMDKVILRKWLKAGFLEKNVLFATTEGTPQGGIISPVLANRTLDGLEDLLARRFRQTHNSGRRKVHLVRYADDFIITGTSEVLLEYEVKPLVEQFLKERGLELSHEKTRITHIEDGFDFLGQTIRRYSDGKTRIKPSKRSVKTFLAEIQKEIKEEGGHCTAGVLIRNLNRKIRGWTMYHRHVCSKRAFAYVDSRIFRMIWRWCKRRHPQKSAKWIKKKYFKQEGNRGWVFSGVLQSREGRKRPTRLMSAASVKIRRHVKIRGEANPYDREWERYFERRLYKRMQATLQGKATIKYLWTLQGGKCPGCGQLLDESQQWQIHHRVRRTDGGGDQLSNLEVLHDNCHRQIHSKANRDEADCVSREAFEEA
jgi:RNA-directed DNA polymerase